ncbi:MAG TPA: helix-turn-helix domain-containing protein [Novosphingobium sp.]|nr:helix-turn-helix domain-containing protein [Novosphingobium sp.]
MPDRISEMRRRKLAVYAEYLGRDAPTRQVQGPIDAMAYLHALAEMVSEAPSRMALEVGSRRRLADLGIIGHLILSAPDLGETLRLWDSHAGMAGELATMSSRVSGEGEARRWTIHFAPLPFLAPELARFVVEELIATFFAFAREATGRDLADFEVGLPFAPSPAVDYPRYMCPTVRFGQRAATVAGPASALALRQVAHDAETFDLLVSRLREPSGRHGPADLLARLREGLMARPGEPPRLDIIARGMGMSARTLSRGLAREGTSFAQVLSDYRRTIAIDLLQSRAMSVAEVAHLLGYRSESGLRRAFVEWTGLPVARWRQSLANQKGSLAY